MPEYPDVTVYIEALNARILGKKLESIRIAHPFLLRSVDPAPQALYGLRVTGLRRIGKQIVVALENSLFMVIHLMIAGRFLWTDLTAGEARPRPPGKIGLAAFDFESGTLIFTEAGTKKRASLHLVRGEDKLADFDRGGLEIMEASPEKFAQALHRENHTLKRTLTDPRLFSGIGNSYSDEILHRARLSPFRQTSQLSDAEILRLYEACRAILEEWTVLLRNETKDKFPAKVTAFRKEMAVHGKFGQPCPVCGTPVQHIVYAENEANYCAVCQTEGRLLADRALSRLLKGDWPETVQELEEMKRPRA